MVLWGYNDSKRPHHGHEKCSSSTSPLLWLGTWRPCTRLRELFHVKEKKRKQKQNCLLCMLMRSVHNTQASIPICRQLLTLPSWKYIWTFFDVSTLIGNLVSSIWLSLKAFISSAFFVILLCVCVSVIPNSSAWNTAVVWDAAAAAAVTEIYSTPRNSHHLFKKLHSPD